MLVRHVIGEHEGDSHTEARDRDRLQGLLGECVSLFFEAAATFGIYPKANVMLLRSDEFCLTKASK